MRIQLAMGWMIVAAIFCLAACDTPATEDCNYDVAASVFPEGIRESARIYYPCDIGQRSELAATTLSNGRGGAKERMYWLAQSLAQAGMVVCVVSAVENTTVEGYQIAQLSALGLLKWENGNSGNPLYGKLAHYGLTGYSMGGGAAVLLASQLGPEIKACVALAPWVLAPSSTLTAATLVLTGEDDDIVTPDAGAGMYEEIPAGVPKAYASMAKANHFFWIDNDKPGSADDYIIAWLKYWLEGDLTQEIILEAPQSDMKKVRLEAPPLALPADGGGCR